VAVLQALLQRASLPLDPFTVPLRPPCDAPLERLRLDLQTRLGDVLRVGTTRRIYRGLICAPTSLSVLIPFRETMHEASQLAQTRIEVALGHARMAGEVSGALDLPDEARFVHTSLTGYFHRSLLPGWSPTTDDALAAIVRHALRCPLRSP
jgi:TetR/AcrR family transcriptional regulator, acrAB operon repressor